MKSKKLTVLTLSLLLCSTAFTACGMSSKSATKPENQENNTKQTATTTNATTQKNNENTTSNTNEKANEAKNANPEVNKTKKYKVANYKMPSEQALEKKSDSISNKINTEFTPVKTNDSKGDTNVLTFKHKNLDIQLCEESTKVPYGKYRMKMMFIFDKNNPKAVEYVLNLLKQDSEYIKWDEFYKDAVNSKSTTYSSEEDINNINGKPMNLKVTYGSYGDNKYYLGREFDVYTTK